MLHGPLPEPTRSRRAPRHRSRGGAQRHRRADLNAGGVGGLAEAARLAKTLFDHHPDRTIELRTTLFVDELAEIRRPAAGRRVVLIGGDGTLHDAVNLPGPAPEVALIPAGRANDVARSLGIPLATADAARLACAGLASPIDLSGRRAIPGMPVRRHHGHGLIGSRRTGRPTLGTRGSPVMVDTENRGPGPVEVTALPAALDRVRR